MDFQIQELYKQYDPKNQFAFLNTYLSVALKLSQIFDIYGILEKAGVRPGNTYSIDEILSPLESEFGVGTMIPVCDVNRPTDEYLLKELKFCLDLNYNPTPCKQQSYEQ